MLGEKYVTCIYFLHYYIFDRSLQVKTYVCSRGWVTIEAICRPSNKISFVDTDIENLAYSYRIPLLKFCIVSQFNFILH